LSSSSPAAAAHRRWGSLRANLSAVLPPRPKAKSIAAIAATVASAATKLANEWEAVVELAHSLDVPREQLIDELLNND
jgi:hypothetical protein